jgi:hypothetical protein
MKIDFTAWLTCLPRSITRSRATRNRSNRSTRRLVPTSTPLQGGFWLARARSSSSISSSSSSSRAAARVLLLLQGCSARPSGPPSPARPPIAPCHAQRMRVWPRPGPAASGNSTGPQSGTHFAPVPLFEFARPRALRLQRQNRQQRRAEQGEAAGGRNGRGPVAASAIYTRVAAVAFAAADRAQAAPPRSSLQEAGAEQEQSREQQQHWQQDRAGPTPGAAQRERAPESARERARLAAAAALALSRA